MKAAFKAYFGQQPHVIHFFLGCLYLAKFSIIPTYRRSKMSVIFAMNESGNIKDKVGMQEVLANGKRILMF